MTKKRFFILQLEDDDLPCIRDRTFQLDDIYGHYKYDNLEQLCSFLNEQHEENQRLSKDRQLAETEVMRIRQALDEAIKTERTELGRSVLKQFKQSITGVYLW